MTPRSLSSLLALALLPFATAQELRRGLVGADAVLVARQVGKTAHDENLTLHRLQVLVDVRGGGGAAAVTVLDWPKLALHQRPTLRQSRLYCLQDASATANRLGLPAADGPYYKMVGWPGSNPLVGAEPDRDPFVQFARVLAAGDAGTSPADTASALYTTALGTDVTTRFEATKHLAERADLRSKLGGLQWSQLLARATGEVDDIGYKTALAELCAAQRLDGVFDALVVSLGQVTDIGYARTVGRIGKALHGEDAAARLVARLQQAGQPGDRAALLLALGATNTAQALDALLVMDKKDAAVEAALREHRSPRAREAVADKKQPPK
ncbi:MAG: hypothetical protein WAT39_12435 [Planctomycetota bacterium]